MTNENALQREENKAGSSVSDLEPMVLAVAPNGARKQKSDHAQLPITASELADTAADCLESGAAMMHIHVRDGAGKHSIDAASYHDAFNQIRQRVGEKSLFLQATTEAVGMFSPKEQMQTVYELAELENGQNPFGVSLAVRELMSQSVSDDDISTFFLFLQDREIHPQLILYDESDCQRFQDLLARGVLPGSGYPCLFVLGRYQKDQQSTPHDLLPFFAHMRGVSSWMGCAFGRKEARVATTAALLGGHMRIGFENNCFLADGSLAPDNSALIAQTASDLTRLDRKIATYEETQAIMRPAW